uniref:Uncharacterized protein n=1 Tax=Knipowitschia caucasica TaxID=637954 RepID=A0AAV2M1B7_KNICA
MHLSGRAATPEGWVRTEQTGIRLSPAVSRPVTCGSEPCACTDLSSAGETRTGIHAHTHTEASGGERLGRRSGRDEGRTSSSPSVCPAAPRRPVPRCAAVAQLYTDRSGLERRACVRQSSHSPLLTTGGLQRRLQRPLQLCFGKPMLHMC